MRLMTGEGGIIDHGANEICTCFLISSAQTVIQKVHMR